MSKKSSFLDRLFLIILAIAFIFLFIDNDFLRLLSKIGIAGSLFFLVIRNTAEYWNKFSKK